MNMALDCLYLMVSLVVPNDVYLLVAIGVGSRWVHPIYYNIVLITSTSFMSINKVPITSSAAEDTKCFRIDVTYNSVPLCMFGIVASD